MNSSSEFSVASKWDRYIDKLNLNNVHKKRKCYVILAVEKTAMELEKLLMIRYHSESNVRNEVKFISLNDIYDFIISYETKRLFVHEPIRTMLRKCCHEARGYLRRGNTLPLDLLAKLIKLKIITIITNDVHQHKYPRMIGNESAFEPKHVHFQNISRRQYDRGGKLHFREMYVVLIQFYSPRIIPACCQCGLSISALVELGNKNEKFQKSLMETVPSRQSDVFRQEFWKKAPTLYYQHNLDEPFRLMYNPKTTLTSKDNPQMYARECKRLYNGFVKSIDIDKIKHMKETLIHQYGLYELVLSEIAKDRKEVEEKVVDKSSSNGSWKSESSGAGWEESKPFVKRVLPELDIDTRKRYTKWPMGRFC
ncbi:hypothetical protein Trydic_g6607 [Trypoxylus dichotomus]